jgi:aspartyl/glutamyl-tRNA(Asn/Gln) amidotransferase C subunit
LPRKPEPRASVDARQVERLADLSGLSLTPEEAGRFRGELSTSLDFFAALDGVDVSSAPEPAAPEEQPWQREDVAAPSTPDDVLRCVPEKKGRYVRAPRVF